MSEGHAAGVDIARRWRTPRGQRPRARTETLCAGTGRSCAYPRRMAPRVVSGSPRANADDERAQEVGQTRSTREAPEQSRATGGGGSGGKGSGQRELGRAKRASDTAPIQRAQCARASTSSSKKGKESAVHGAPASHLRPEHAARGLLRPEEGSRPRRGRRDVAALRAGTGGKSSGSVGKAGTRSVPGETGSTGVHPQG